MRRALPVLLLLFATSCDEDGATLVLELRTDLVPGVEFSGVVVSVPGRAPEQTVARPELDFIGGVRVADVSGLPRADLRVEVDLITPDGMIRRPVVVNLAQSLVYTVRVFRSCRLIECPGAGDPTLEACFDGRCVLPSCTEQTPEACGRDDDCTRDDDCPAQAMCASRVCDDGYCYYRPIAGACGAGLFCRAESGCERLPDLPDAGPGDAGRSGDAGELDAGAPDAGTRSCTVPSGVPSPFAECTGSSSPTSLVEATIIAARNGCFVEGGLVGGPEVISFVPLTQLSDDGYLELFSDGSFRFIGRDIDTVLNIAIQVNTTLGLVSECLRVFIIDPATRTKRLVGPDGTMASSWDPPGLPGGPDTVWIPLGTHTVSLPQVSEIFIETGATLNAPGGVGTTALFGRIVGDVRITGGGVMAGTVDGRLEVGDGPLNLEGATHVTGDFTTARSTVAAIMSPFARLTIDGSFDGVGTDIALDGVFPGWVLAVGGDFDAPRLATPLIMGTLIVSGSALTLGTELPQASAASHLTVIDGSGPVTITAPELGAVSLAGPGGRVTFNTATALQGPLDTTRPTDFAVTPTTCGDLNLGAGWSTMTPMRYSGCGPCTDDLGQCASLGL